MIEGKLGRFEERLVALENGLGVSFGMQQQSASLQNQVSEIKNYTQKYFERIQNVVHSATNDREADRLWFEQHIEGLNSELDKVKVENAVLKKKNRSLRKKSS